MVWMVLEAFGRSRTAIQTFGVAGPSLHESLAGHAETLGLAGCPRVSLRLDDIGDQRGAAVDASMGLLVLL
jgi:hypothetical protein